MYDVAMHAIWACFQFYEGALLPTTGGLGARCGAILPFVVNILPDAGVPCRKPSVRGALRALLVIVICAQNAIQWLCKWPPEYLILLLHSNTVPQNTYLANHDPVYVLCRYTKAYALCK